MARSTDSRINRLRALRRKRFRQIKRALQRGAPLRLIRRLRHRAQGDLAAIRKLRKLKKHPQSPNIGPGVTRFDGVPVAMWLVPYLRWARSNGWRGRLVSGWRDPRYSEQLCYRMCGAPRCPGRCAGRSSNHSGSAKPRGAVDVSDYRTFGALMQRCPYEPKLINRLGVRDPVHFSQSGV